MSIVAHVAMSVVPKRSSLIPGALVEYRRDVSMVVPPKLRKTLAYSWVKAGVVILAVGSLGSPTMPPPRMIGRVDAVMVLWMLA